MILEAGMLGNWRLDSWDTGGWSGKILEAGRLGYWRLEWQDTGGWNAGMLKAGRPGYLLPDISFAQARNHSPCITSPGVYRLRRSCLAVNFPRNRPSSHNAGAGRASRA